MAAKLDMQFTIEEKMIIGKIEKSNHELKNKLVKSIKKLEDTVKLQIRSLRNDSVSRVNRIKMIASTDDVRKMINTIDTYQNIYVEQTRRYATDKEREIRNAE